MRINPVCMAPQFRGRVIMDRQKIADSIAGCPEPVRASLTKNIDTLVKDIEKNTPDGEEFKLDFSQDYSYFPDNYNQYCRGIIQVGNDKRNTGHFRLFGMIRTFDGENFELTDRDKKISEEVFTGITKDILNEYPKNDVSESGDSESETP